MLHVHTALVLVATGLTAAQGPSNRVINPGAEQGLAGWRRSGEADVEEFEGRRCFVVRNGGAFRQRVNLPLQAQKRFMLFIARVSAERVGEPDGTDKPYLWGMTMTAEGRILMFNQGQMMGTRTDRRNEWTVASGIFPVPDGATVVSFELRQASIRGVPHTGSAARFDDVGLYIFGTEEDARDFISRFPGRE